MPRTKEQFEDMRVKSKNTIIETALKLFSTKGYHVTSISAIAKEAGVAVGLMYNYFSSKEDLLVSMINEYFDKLFDSMRQEIGEVSVSTDVRKIIDAMISAITKRNDSWKLIISVMFQPDVSKIATQRIEEFSLHQNEIFKRYFIAKGVSDPEKSAKVLGVLLHAAFLNYAHSGNSSDLKLIRDTVVERLLESGI